ncbi:MAG: hypothetical protein U5N55_13900 [Cypionkella sp.]|nr:hypothetical protein [Cypionkella sp.]
MQGTVGGAQQKSQIISVDASYKLNKTLPWGGKYGYRFGEVLPRGSNVFTDSQADLAVLRLDYHVVHNWDIMVEGRAAHDKTNNVRETGAMTGVFRHFGNNIKAGIGYQFGDVSSDLRDIEGRSEGAFFNIVSKF